MHARTAWACAVEVHRAECAEGVLYITLVLVLLTLNMGSIGVLIFERAAPDSNIRHASDAIWWSFVTITTVGYGDHFPVTWGGRIVGMS